MSNFGQVKLCVFCDNYYDSKNAVGVWDCSYHPENTYYNERRMKFLFKCCDKPKNSVGCAPCDHTTEEEIDIDKVKVSFDEFACFNTKPPKARIIDGNIVYKDEEAKKIDTEKSYVYIKKHD